MENTTKIIKIIKSHLKVLNAQLDAHKARWDINDTKIEHDRLTGSCSAWSQEDREAQRHKEDRLEYKILALTEVLWDLESVGIDTKNLQS